ncbi:MAG: polysaccharide pyruvyl transferase family protein [Oscillospiraceae bacterium]|nr:polysaccharide pyruvyl transferase family protein [Oscillospiraceae bacterium]
MVPIKISCLTFHDSLNYGAVLQAYALQTYCIKNGYEYEIINYSNVEKHKFDSVFGRNKELPLLVYFYKLLQFPYHMYKKHKFKNFSKKYLHVSKRYKLYQQLKDYAKTRDAILVGSDQVWNISMVREDPIYFLDFADANKRISYAASLGLAVLNESQRQFYSKMLSDFEHISVREETGKEIVLQASGKNAQVVVDPTLLLSKKDWKKIAVYRKPGKYIFAYILRHDPEVQIFLEKLKKQTGLPVIYVSRGYISAVRDKATAVPSPQKWVGLIMDATYVVTTSFHGTAFSVNFHRNFYTFVKGKITDDTNSRQVGFLKSLGLENRLNPEALEEICLDPPDYTMADQVLASKRMEARQFLESALKKVTET